MRDIYIVGRRLCGQNAPGGLASGPLDRHIGAALWSRREGIRPMSKAWTERIRGEPAAAAALAVFVLGAATLLGAWYFQYVVKLAALPALPRTAPAL